MQIFKIDSVAGVYVDALVRSEAGVLVFISVFGRDTGIKELMARMQLNQSDSLYLGELKLQDAVNGGEIHRATVLNANSLSKHTGRLPKCLYGALNHAWIYDPAMYAPDKGAQSAWIIEPLHNELEIHQSVINQRTWQSVCELSAIPLLPHWQTTILQLLRSKIVTQMGNAEHGVNTRFSKPLGAIDAWHVQLDDEFPSLISSMVKSGVLTLEPLTAVQEQPVNDNELLAALDA